MIGEVVPALGPYRVQPASKRSAQKSIPSMGRILLGEMHSRFRWTIFIRGLGNALFFLLILNILYIRLLRTLFSSNSTTCSS